MSTELANGEDPAGEGWPNVRPASPRVKDRLIPGPLAGHVGSCSAALFRPGISAAARLATSLPPPHVHRSSSRSAGGSAPAGSTVEDVRVDLGRADVQVTEELLHGADVVVVLEEVGGEGVPADPRDVGLLRATAVVPRAHRLADPIEESRFGCAGGAGLTDHERRDEGALDDTEYEIAPLNRGVTMPVPPSPFPRGPRP